jgi:hypothetical protein
MFGPVCIQYTRKMHKFKFSEKYFPKMQVMFRDKQGYALQDFIQKGTVCICCFIQTV